MAEKAELKLTRRSLHVALLYFACAGLAVALIVSRRSRIGDERAMLQPVEDPPAIFVSRRVGELVFRNTPLEECLDKLARAANAPMLVRWGELEEQGMRKSTPMTIGISNLRLDQAVALLARAYLDEDGTFHELSASEKEGKVIIGGKAPPPVQALRAYDVADLLAEHFALKTHWTPRFRGGFSGFVEETRTFDEIDQRYYETGVGDLRSIISFALPPTSGTGFSPQFWRGWMLARTSEAEHRKIVKMLQLLRAEPPIRSRRGDTRSLNGVLYDDDLRHELATRPVAAMHFAKTPLSTALQMIAYNARLSLQGDWVYSTSTQKGYQDVPVTLDVEATTLRAMLNRVLSVAAKSPDFPLVEPPRWYLTGEIIRINSAGLMSSESQPEGEMITRTYDVLDLLLAEAEVQARDERAQAQHFNEFGSYAMAQASSLLIGTLHAQTGIGDPLNWYAGQSVMSLWAGKVVVTALEGQHRRFVRVLEAMRAARPTTKPTTYPTTGTTGRIAP